MKKKRNLLAVLFVLVAVLSLPMTTNAAKARLNKTKGNVFVGKTLQLKLLNNKKKVKWTSNKKSVATVSKKGKVTARKGGLVTITAKAGGKSYKCKLTVVPNVSLSANDFSAKLLTYKIIRDGALQNEYILLTYRFRNNRGNRVQPGYCLPFMMYQHGKFMPEPTFSGDIMPGKYPSAFDWMGANKAGKVMAMFLLTDHSLISGKLSPLTNINKYKCPEFTLDIR